MIELLGATAGAVTGDWKTVTDPGSYLIAINRVGVTVGTTLEIQLADLDENLLSASTDLLFSGVFPEPKLVFLPAAIKVRAVTTGGAWVFDFLNLIPADARDGNRGLLGRN